MHRSLQTIGILFPIVFLFPAANAPAQEAVPAQEARKPDRTRSGEPTRIIVIRHAETIANRTGKYNSRTVNTLTERGRRQVAELTRRLKSQTHDHILVSPVSRARQSILPYLVGTNQTAQIWPSLAECCHQRDRDAGPSPEIPRGKPIEISAEEQGYMTLEGSPSDRRYWPASYADGMEQVRLAAGHLRDRFAGSGSRVLVICHSIIGSRLLELLCDEDPRGRYRLDNVAISILVEDRPGKFRIERLNDKPFGDG